MAVKLMMSVGADGDLRDKQGMTPVELAVSAENFRTARIMCLALYARHTRNHPKLIARLLGELGNGSKKQRAKAEERLREIGWAAYPLLLQALETTGTDDSAGAARMINCLEKGPADWFGLRQALQYGCVR